jgi:predicted RNA-binding Zn ribbon-like protein
MVEPPKFEWIADCLCLDFVNTVSWEGDGTLQRERLASYADLVEWARTAGVIREDALDRLRGEASADPSIARRALGRAWSLRQAMRDVFRAAARGERPPAASAARLNVALRESSPAFAIDPDADGLALRHIVASEDELLAPVARSAATLLGGTDMVLVRECDGEQCGWLYVDGTKNRSRRWCDMKVCGNRAKVRRHRSRAATRGRGSGGAA